MRFKNKFKSRLYVGILVIFELSLMDASNLLGEESTELFLIKKYGNLEPYKTYPKKEIPSRYDNLILNNRGLLRESSMLYMYFPEDGFGSKTVITISEFTDNAYAKNELLTRLASRRELIKYITINDKPVLQIGSPCWVSENKYIRTYSSGVEDPTPIYIDYLLLHPPTGNIKESDFDAQKIIKTQIKRSHEIIKDADKMRILPARLTPGLPRAEAYIGMVAQCMAELSIRCWTGMHEGEAVDCPITFIQNDIKRKKEWKKFKSEYMSRPVVEENIVLDSISYAGSPTCAFKHEDVEEGTNPSDMWSIVMNELNMDYKELRALSLTGEKVPSAFIRR